MEGHYYREEECTVDHRPEFVLIDEGGEEKVYGGSHTFQSSCEFEPLHKLKDVKPTAALRIASLLSSLILYGALVLLIFLFLVHATMFLLTLGLVPFFRLATAKYWDLIKKTFVVASGLFVALFSPHFGLAIIVLYFILTTGGTSDPIFSKLFKSGLYS